MSEDIRARLSALVDGELTESDAVRMLNLLNRDAELKQIWERYHLVSDVIRHHLPSITSVDLVERVRQSLDAEPVVFLPSARRAISLKPVASLALAASIAIVAVLGFRGYLGTGHVDNDVVAQTETGQAVPAGAGMRWDVDRPGVEQRLNTYLVNHHGHTGHGMGSMLPYARIVAYNGGR